MKQDLQQETTGIRRLVRAHVRNEDWLAVWLGFLLIAVVLLGRQVPWASLEQRMPAFAWASVADLGKVASTDNLTKTAGVAAILFISSCAAVALSGGNLRRFATGFPVVFILAWLAQVLAGCAPIKAWGLEFVVFALLLGLVVSNVIGVPGWVRQAVRTEFYVKTGLVILGAGILFGEVFQAGMLGVMQSLGVVTTVWFFCFWLARRLRVDDEFAAMLSSAVAICGVSAAIAACGAVQGNPKKLSYVTSLVLIVAVPMMIVMPWVISALGIPEMVGGAWLGGTLDTSGSVVAAGQMIGDTAMKAGVVVKFSQNVLLGLAAFLLSTWWAFKENAAAHQRPSLRVIWERFPKFVLGFLAASLVFSFLVDPESVKGTKPVLEGIRTAWFALAFTSIGLETRFGDLWKMEGGRPAAAFLGAQAFNVLWTLLLAFLFFGGWLFPLPPLK